jgi:hypothetical protein
MVQFFILNEIIMWKINIPIIRPPTAPMHDSGLFSPFMVRNIQPSFMREAELKHCRLAMISVLYPIYTLSIYEIWFLLWFMLLYECKTMHLGWKTPFTLKDTYQPGDLGLGMWDKEDGDLMDKELNHGRLAIISMFIYFIMINVWK